MKFDSEGEDYLHEQISKLMKWHNTFMLPRYAAYFRIQANLIDKGLYGNVNIIQAINDGRILLEGTVSGATPYAAKILIRQTTVDKIEHLSKKMIERMEEQKQKLARPIDIRVEDRTQRIKKNLNRFLGDLNHVQNDLVEKYVKTTINDGNKRLINRTLRQKAFLTFLAAGPNEASLKIFVKKILLRSHEIVDPSYEDFSSNRIEQFAMLLAQILSASTEEQRRLTSRKLRSLAQDLEDLSS